MPMPYEQYAITQGKYKSYLNYHILSAYLQLKMDNAIGFLMVFMLIVDVNKIFRCETDRNQHACMRPERHVSPKVTGPIFIC